MPFSSTVKRSVIVAAPILLVVFSLLHGADWLAGHGMSDPDPHEFIDWMSSIRRRWLAVHVAGLALFPLFGVAVWSMLPSTGLASRVSRFALSTYIVLYAAFDAMVGIGSAVLLEYREGAPSDERSVVDGVIMHLMGSHTTSWFGDIASLSWAVGLLAAAAGLWTRHGWRVSAPLSAAGILMAWSHFPPFGAGAGAMLGLAAWQYLARDQTDTEAVNP
jgi:hypothetical protein